MNIEGNMLTWISRFLDQKLTKVKYGETSSKYKQTRVGLPQGAVTSTTLFNAYINDLPNTVKKQQNQHRNVCRRCNYMDLHQEQR